MTLFYRFALFTLLTASATHAQPVAIPSSGSSGSSSAAQSHTGTQSGHSENPVLPIIQSGPFVYADTQGHFFVIAVRSASESGLFVAYSPTPISIQEFSPDQLPKDAAVLFLSYDPGTNRYKQLVVSSARTYIVQGSFRVRIGPDVWMGVDTFNNPYTSFVLERKGEKPAIISFVGVEKVVLSQNERAVALLSATQSLESYKSFVNEYQLGRDELYLKNQPLKVSQIGIQTSFNNVCFSEGTVVLSQNAIEKARAMKDSSDLQRFLDSEKDKSRNIIESLITVKMTENEMTGYLPDKETFYFVERQNLKLNDRAVCLLSQAEL